MENRIILNGKSLKIPYKKRKILEVKQRTKYTVILVLECGHERINKSIPKKPMSLCFHCEPNW